MSATMTLPAYEPMQAEYLPTYRLTRRGRLVVFLVGFVALVALGIAFAGGSVATPEPEQTTTIVVAPGESLWSIAADLTESGGDVRSTMDHLVKLNSLDSVMLAAGQTLEIPAD